MKRTLEAIIADAIRSQFKYRSATVDAITACISAALKGVPLEPQPERIIQIAVGTDEDGESILVGLDNIGRTWTQALTGPITRSGWRSLCDASLPHPYAPAVSEPA